LGGRLCRCHPERRFGCSRGGTTGKGAKALSGSVKRRKKVGGPAPILAWTKRVELRSPEARSGTVRAKLGGRVNKWSGRRVLFSPLAFLPGQKPCGMAPASTRTAGFEKSSRNARFLFVVDSRWRVPSALPGPARGWVEKRIIPAGEKKKRPPDPIFPASPSRLMLAGNPVTRPPPARPAEIMLRPPNPPAPGHYAHRSTSGTTIGDCLARLGVRSRALWLTQNGPI